MFSLGPIRKLMVAAALVLAPVASFASVFISVGFAPPALPVYSQPICPGDGYLWNPGYWAYGPEGYYWVPGVWVQPPVVGYLWTPPYWGFEGGVYGFHEGYWGSHVGFYGGVNYGFGFGGVGFVGGRWDGGHFMYNTAVMNVGGGIHNTYVDRTVIVNNNYSHASFNGPGGVQRQPTPQEAAAMHESHVPPTPAQQSHFQAAAQNRANFASANGGHPAMAAIPRPGVTQGAVPARGAAPVANQQGAARGGFGQANQARPGTPQSAQATRTQGFGQTNQARPQQATQARPQVQQQARPQAQQQARPEVQQARPQAQAARPQMQQQARPQAQAARPAPAARPAAAAKEEGHGHR